MTPGARLAVFDLDGTLLDGDSHAVLLRDLALDPAVPWRTRVEIVAGALAWAVGLVDNTWTKAVAARALAGRDAGALRAFCEGFTTRRVLPMLRPAMVQRVRDARRDGYHVVVLSASLVNVVALVASELGADVAVGTRLAMAHGVATGGLDGKALYGAEKALYLAKFAREHGADLARSCSYGDGLSDRFVLALVGAPRVVAPGVRMRWYAWRRGWPVVDVSR